MQLCIYFGVVTCTSVQAAKQAAEAARQADLEASAAEAAEASKRNKNSGSKPMAKNKGGERDQGEGKEAAKKGCCSII